jgi:ribosomal RNA-processing protein 7
MKTPTMKASTIKGYIPVRIELPPIILGRSDDVDRQHRRHTFTSFIYVKEHAPNTPLQRSAAADDDDGGDSTATRTLFVANCPANGPMSTDAYLRAIFESTFDANIVRVTVVRDRMRHRHHHHASMTASMTGTAAPNDVFFRQETSAAGLDDDDVCAHGRRRGDGKFAHVVFATSNEMKRVVKKLVVVNGERPLRLEDGVIHRLLSVGRTKVDDDDNNDEGRLRGIHAVVARAHNKAGRHMSRRDLMRLCNDVMTSYERDEEGMINEAKLAKDRPDDDGFVTVTYNKKKTSTSSSMTMMTATSSIGLEEDGIGGGGGGRQRGGGGRGMGDDGSSKRNRKRKSNNNIISGADELTDFYRYQMKHTRKVEVQELKKRFEEDLLRVRKMKEERAYRPF